MWALVVTVCLAGGDTASCETWTSEPMEARGECVAMMPVVAKPIVDLDPLYIGVRFVRGRYS